MKIIIAVLYVALLLGCSNTSTTMDAKLDDIDAVTREFLELAETGKQISPSDFSALADKQRALYTSFGQSLERTRLTSRQQDKWNEIDALNKKLKLVVYSPETQRLAMKEIQNN